MPLILSNDLRGLIKPILPKTTYNQTAYIMNMYKKRNRIRLSAFIILLSIAGVLYLLAYGQGTEWEVTLLYVLGGIAFITLILYLIQMSQFRGKLDKYFDEQG